MLLDTNFISFCTPDERHDGDASIKEATSPAVSQRLRVLEGDGCRIMVWRCVSERGTRLAGNGGAADEPKSGRFYSRNRMTTRRVFGRWLKGMMQQIWVKVGSEGDLASWGGHKGISDFRAAVCKSCVFFAADCWLWTVNNGEAKTITERSGGRDRSQQRIFSIESALYLKLRFFFFILLSFLRKCHKSNFLFDTNTYLLECFSIYWNYLQYF